MLSINQNRRKQRKHLSTRHLLLSAACVQPPSDSLKNYVYPMSSRTGSDSPGKISGRVSTSTSHSLALLFSFFCSCTPALCHQLSRTVFISDLHHTSRGRSSSAAPHADRSSALEPSALFSRPAHRLVSATASHTPPRTLIFSLNRLRAAFSLAVHCSKHRRRRCI